VVTWLRTRFDWRHIDDRVTDVGWAYSINTQTDAFLDTGDLLDSAVGKRPHHRREAHSRHLVLRLEPRGVARGRRGDGGRLLRRSARGLPSARPTSTGPVDAAGRGDERERAVRPAARGRAVGTP
jgi:hypothetical protein